MRWLLRLLIAMLLLSVLGLGIFLGPAHLQIRNIAPPLPTEADLRALATVPGGPISIRVVQSSSQIGPSRTLGHTAVVIQWPDGRSFMIDAAMDRQASEDFGELVAKLSPNMEPVAFHGTTPELLGETINSIEGVGFTHLHIDHVQGVDAFCDARGQGARVYQTPWQAEEHNLHTKDSARQLESSCLEQLVLEGEGGLITMSKFPGLGIVALGGHTPGSTLFAVHVDGTLWLMSGDISNVKSNLLTNTDKGWLYSNIMVPENTARTEELRLWLAALDRQQNTEVIVAHDFAAALASGMLRLQTGYQ
ncbi:MAG: glyoxylase-like metal-dependent hydrolase (beta-lactamase superfamily II) [Glaciecola sp.]|jgi:glyoxylase-like metal-dependent hydrolase (beta-lactamase superfamily II)|uniref:MBL fold metallo-hydrolase n=1 Tax=Congregibacter sp. TaxID=2744308 RepID=UPI0039E5CB18